MEDTAKLAQFFFLALSLGMGPFRLLVDVRQTGAGLTKWMAAICGAAILGAVLFGILRSGPNVSPPYLLAFAANAVCYFAIDANAESAPSLSLARAHGWRIWSASGLYHLSLLWALIAFFNFSLVPCLHALNSTLLLGSVSFALVMGHWYLVTPRLSTLPLRVALYATWFSLAIKLLVAAVGIWNTDLAVAQPSSRMDALFEYVVWAMRLLWGYAAVGGLSYFAFRLVKMRSLQSATGIFYSMTFFVFAGELTALYVYLQRGIYL